LKVLFVTSEAVPFVKVGGLGDVAGSLPSALGRAGIETRVILPLYGSINPTWRSKMRFVKYIYVTLAWRNLYCGLFELKHEGVTYYFIDNEYYFRRGEIYGHFDDGERFAFFSRAVVDLLPELGFTPDVLHCNDWETALVPVYLREVKDTQPVYQAIKTVFSIHNIEYQGRFSRSILGDVFGLKDDLFLGGMLEFMGGLNLMKGAIELSDAVCTVSPTYADELQYSYYAHGLEGVLSEASGKFTGILNGIDMNLHNPADNPSLFAAYDSKNMDGKAAGKAELQQTLGLQKRDDIPLIGIVGRLVAHKGMDLVTDALEQIMNWNVQFVVLGRGDWHFEQAFAAAQSRYPGRLSANILYSADLATKIYAGADIFLMPSQAEPCGLSQMIAMRYGTVPVVRETGGLKDTVTAYNPAGDEGCGFTFANYNKDDMLHTLYQAVSLYQENQKAWRTLQNRGMTADFSWTRSAKLYAGLYRGMDTVKNPDAGVKPQNGAKGKS
jgi:starch synthase